MSKSLWRELLYRELEKISFEGSVLDLGGSRKSGYHVLLKGNHKITVANLENNHSEDITCDLEESLSLEDGTYDAVLCINVLEHIFNYQGLLNESCRVTRAGGLVVYAVPFLIQVHPSPRDHWRFTKATLEHIFKNAGFSHVEVQAIGTGVCGAVSQLQHNLFRFSVLQWVAKFCARIGDAFISQIKPNSFFSKEYYPLGYIVRARK